MIACSSSCPLWTKWLRCVDITTSILCSPSDKTAFNIIDHDKALMRNGGWSCNIGNLYAKTYPIYIRQCVRRYTPDIDDLQRRLLHMSSRKMTFRLDQLQDPSFGKERSHTASKLILHFDGWCWWLGWYVGMSKPFDFDLFLLMYSYSYCLLRSVRFCAINFLANIGQARYCRYRR